MKAPKGKAITLKNINPELFKDFKVACAENDTDMRQALLWFMKEYGAGDMYEISDGVNTASFDNLFVGLDAMLFHAEGHKKGGGKITIRKMK